MLINQIKMQTERKQEHLQIRRPASSFTTLSTSSSAMDRYFHQLRRDASKRRQSPINMIVLENDNPFMLPMGMSQSFSSHIDISSCEEDLDVSFREDRWENPERIMLQTDDGTNHTQLSMRKVRSRQKRLPPVPIRKESFDANIVAACGG